MAGKKNKTLILALSSGAIVLGVIAYSIAASVGSGSALEYFKDVHQALESPKEWKDKRLRLRGNVVSGTIQKKSTSLDYRFALYSKNRWIEVTYHGLVPDTFKDCAEVVVKGKMVDESQFHADEITAKCPSKYEESQRLSGCGLELKPKVIAARAKANKKQDS